MNLDAINKQIREAKKLLALQKAREQISEVPTADLGIPDPNTVTYYSALTSGQFVSYTPVFRYLAQLRAMPRTTLEAKFEQVFQEKPVNWCSRLWMIEVLARKFQADYLVTQLGKLPPSVERNNRLVEMSSPWPMTEEERIERDIKDSDAFIDPQAKLVALVSNPFARGKTSTMFAAVEASGPSGISFAMLVIALAKFFDIPKEQAKRRVHKMFTSWVREGWMKIIYQTQEQPV